MATSTLVVLTLAAGAACGDGGEPEPDSIDLPLAQPVAREERPHILLIVLSSARADRFSAHGYGRPTTPQLEALAREGVAYDACWSPAASSPSAYGSLFTAASPWQHGVTDDRTYLTRDAITLAECLGAAGYETACFAADPFLSPDHGLTQGFRHVFPAYRRPDRGVETTCLEAANWAVEAAARGRSFFLLVNAVEAQLPLRPPAARQAAFLSVPEATEAEIESARAFDLQAATRTFGDRFEAPPRLQPVLSDLYDAEIAGIDAAIGRLLSRLRREKVLDRTLVVVTGEHGLNLGEEGGRIGHLFSLGRPVLNVPLVIRMPGRFEGGRRERGVVRLEDVGATILDAVGLAAADDADGRPLPGAGELDERVARATWGPRPDLAPGLREQHPDIDPALAERRIDSVFDGRWHYLREVNGDRVRHRLFDVVADPAETQNLAESEPETVSRLKERLPRK